MLARKPKKCRHRPDAATAPVIPAGHFFCEYCGRHRYLYFKRYEMISIVGVISLLKIGIFALYGQVATLIENQRIFVQTTAQGAALTVLVPTITSANNTSTHLPSQTNDVQPVPTSTSIPTSTDSPPPTATFSSIPTLSIPSSVPDTSLFGVITTPRLNLRHAPNPEEYIVYRISQGDRVQVVGRNSNATWVVVDAGIVGWAHVDYITIEGNINSLTVFSPSALLPVSTMRFSFVCPGARGPSFNLNEQFFVPYGDDSTAVRDEPSSRTILENAPEGSGGVIIAGPICSAGANGSLIYWYVQTDRGTRGYMSEGYGSDRTSWIAPQ